MKTLIAILILFLSGECSAYMGSHIASGGMVVESGGGECMSGTYMSAWNGDHSSGAGYICINSGASNKNYNAQSGGTLTSTSFVVTDKDQYVEWTNSGNDLFNEDEGTLWIEVNFDAGNNANVYFCEVYYDGTNYIGLQYMDTTNYIYTRRRGGAADDTLTSSGTVTKGATVTVGVSWSVGRDTADFALTVNGGSSWDEENDGIATMTAPDDVRIGNLDISTNNSQTVTITQFAIQTGWETACPW